MHKKINQAINIESAANSVESVESVDSEILARLKIDKNILLCVSASIAAYKALELASALKKLGARVAVVMSEEAKKFIAPLSFEALTHCKVLHQDSEDWAHWQVDSKSVESKNMDSWGVESIFAESGGAKNAESTKLGSADFVDSINRADFASLLDSGTASLDFSTNLNSCANLDSGIKSSAPRACNHIAYAQWADICILCPASANTIAKLAAGIADTLVLQALLATPAPLLIAPAMNTQMLLAPQTRQNLATLASFGARIIAPRSALLACDTRGLGALADMQEILYQIAKVVHLDSAWRGREVCITGGGASERIDSVRAITNHSSGLQASCLAIALYTLGARVTLISSAFPLKMPNAVRQIRVQTNAEYKNALESIAQKYHENLENMENLRGKENLKNRESLENVDSRNVDSKNTDSRNADFGTPKSSQKIILFMAAALVDFAPLNPQAHKIKKAAIESSAIKFGKAESKSAPESKGAESKKMPETTAPNLTLQLKINDDILSGLDSSVFVKIGFKAEDDTKEAILNAQKMLLNVAEGGKGCKAVCLNTIPYATPRAQNQTHQESKNAESKSMESKGTESKSLESKSADLDPSANPFGSAKNSFLLLDEKSLKDARHIVKLAQKDKLTLSYEIADFVKSHLAEWDNESPKNAESKKADSANMARKAESKKPSAESKNTKAQDFAPKNNKNIKSSQKSIKK